MSEIEIPERTKKQKRRDLTLKISVNGVVENLEETPSSQLRAFWRETPGAAEVMSVPSESFEKALEKTPIRPPFAADLKAGEFLSLRIDIAIAAKWDRVVRLLSRVGGILNNIFLTALYQQTSFRFITINSNSTLFRGFRNSTHFIVWLPPKNSQIRFLTVYSSLTCVENIKLWNTFSSWSSIKSVWLIHSKELFKLSTNEKTELVLTFGTVTNPQNYQ